jgi:hypothetical protein
MDEPAHIFGIEALTLHNVRYYTAPAQVAARVNRLKVRAQTGGLCANASQGGPAEHREEGRPGARFIAGLLISGAAGGRNVSNFQKQIGHAKLVFPC